MSFIDIIIAATYAAQAAGVAGIVYGLAALVRSEQW